MIKGWYQAPDDYVFGREPSEVSSSGAVVDYSP
jgi:hypothetical protein